MRHPEAERNYYRRAMGQWGHFPSVLRISVGKPPRLRLGGRFLPERGRALRHRPAIDMGKSLRIGGD